MKRYHKLSLLLIIISVLLLTACTPPPPPVSKDQLSVATQETLDAEKKANSSKQQKEELAKQLKDKEDKLSSLNEIENTGNK